MDLTPGTYEALQRVNIRREPRIVEYQIGRKFITNRVGEIGTGTSRAIYSVLTDSKGQTWGRVSQSDNKGVAEWICLQNLNTVFMKPLSSVVVVVPTAASLEQRVGALEAWARRNGFEGPTS